MYPSSSGGILSFLKGVDIPAFLDGTSKTLNVINQAIPVFYQVKPIIGNLGTLFKITNAMNTNDTGSSVNAASNNSIPMNSSPTIKTNNSPIFYI